MCECKNIEMGSYNNQVMLKSPSWSSHVFICVDICLRTEIEYLWSKHISTTGCCCGHNTTTPMINVKEEYHDKMIEIGYNFTKNKFGVYCYIPKSV